MSYASLCLALLAVSGVLGQQGRGPAPAPGPSDVLARIRGPARAPTDNVTTNLVRVPAGTVYYGDATQDNLYEGEGGPSNWCRSNVGDRNCICQTGTRQSPIDLSLETLQSNNITSSLFQPPNPTVLTASYSTMARVNVTNPGHGTPQINIAPGSPNSTLNFNGRTFELVQVHMHAPGEHVFNSTRADIEAHFVHRDPTTNGLAVFGVFFSMGGLSSDPLLEFTLANRPNNTYRGANGLTAWNATVLSSPVNLQTLLAPYLRGHFLYYQGSLTTPPCSEGVQWFLFPRLFDMTDEQYATFEEYGGGQFEAFNSTFSGNKRPSQPLNNRIVEFY